MRSKKQRGGRRGNESDRGDRGGGGFVFRDRSGKVHVRGSGGGGAGVKEKHAPRSDRAAFEPKTPKTPKPDRVHDTVSHKKRDDRPFESRDRKDRGGSGKRWKDRKEFTASSRLDRDERGGHGRRGRPGEHEAPRGPWQDSRGPRRGPKREERKRAVKTGGETPVAGLKLKATVDKNRKGFGFLIFENRRYDDAFIPPRAADRLFHGDRVEVSFGHRGDIDDVRVLEHRFREVVGRFTPHPSRQHRQSGWVVYERKRAREEIFAPEGHAQAKANDWVRARLEFHEDGQHRVTAHIVEVFGADLPPQADIGMVAAEYNLVEEHSPQAVAEAEGFKLEWDPETRRDLRQVPFITIDGETARDFDDAVYVERTDKGHVLWVAIADVSNYVKSGTALDQEALSRATSVYFPERAFHMLPRALSENLCSLRPHEPRLAMVAKMEFDRRGQRLWTEVFEGIIESKRRATYNEVQREWEANQKNRNWEFLPHFELYQTLRKARSDRGSIDFDLPEAELKVAPTGEVISITQRARQDAHRLIEEMMIAANEAVTDWALEREWPFIYRIHDEPAQVSLQRFEELAGHMGVHVALDESADVAQALADVIRRIEGHPAQSLLNMALLRSMKQAQYSADYGEHFGLASEGYTHFTSPIRRYPDLIVHRMLRMAVQVESGRVPRPSRDELDRIQRELEEMAEHCSYRERIASDAERESIKLKQVRAMSTRLGDEFEGKVIGMADAGLFIELKDPYVEGMVAAETIMDDLYQYDESRMQFIGRRTKRAFKISDEVKIQVVRADLDRRQIDFALLRHGPEKGGHLFPRSGIEAARNRSPQAERADWRSGGGRSRPANPPNEREQRGPKGRRDKKRGGGGRGRQDSPGRGGRVAKRRGR